MRLRIKFEKTEAMQYTGNLDLHKSLSRTFRRARLPMKYSQGFNPRPQINLAAPLALGITSEFELADFHLDEEMPVEQVAQAIREAQPPGIRLLTLEEIDRNMPKMQKRLRTSVYRVTLLEDCDDLAERIDRLMAETSVIRTRREKEYDLRPLIVGLRDLGKVDGKPVFEAELMAAPSGGTGRSDEVVAALGLDPFEASYHRVKLVFEEK